jgi:hypothetical protein
MAIKMGISGTKWWRRVENGEKPLFNSKIDIMN